jgi:Zn-dependent membrane protease YugP
MFWSLFNPTWLIIVGPGILLGMWAQFKLSHAYGKYSQIPVDSGITGAQAARDILDRAGLVNIPVEEVPGRLTDHYDPTKRALFLSSDNFRGRSIAAVGVAAHESGHALQHQASYALLNFRMAMVPATGFANSASGLIIGVGILLYYMGMIAPSMFSYFIWAGIILFSVVTLFQLVTLPVEYDASRRAKEQLFKLGLVHEHERVGVAKVLDAAALTYVAALVSSFLTLLYYLSLARDRR